MRWAQSHALLPFLLLPTLVSAQGGLGDACTATDGTATGFNPNCLSGFCRYQSCSDPNNIVNVGGPCTADNECANAETSNERPPSCRGAANEASVCGGRSTFCYAIDSSGTGPSPICASGFCRENACGALTPVGPTGPCSGNYDCSDSSYCSNGVCSDFGNACTATDGSATGATTTCFAGWCRFNSCAAYPSSNVGEACDSDSVCVGAETANQYGPSCGGLPGSQFTCGGPSSFCYALDGSSTGSSPICASGYCRDNACGALTPVGPTGPCTGNFDCSGSSYCTNGVCSDIGNTCTATDGSSTGATTTCYAGWCRFNNCAAYPSSNVGEACDSDLVCVGAETAYEYGPSCGGLPGSQFTCGGPSSFCYALDGSSTGSSPICASGYCRDNACRTLTPVGPTGPCSGNYDCSDSSYCSNGVCSDFGNACTATDGSATGATTTCFAGWCRFNSCAAYPSSNVGEACDSDSVCVGAETANQYGPSCGGLPGSQFTCGGPSSFCYALDGSSTGSSPICASGYCRDNACGSLTPVGPTGPCTGNFDCSGSSYCTNGVCSDIGNTCTATDGSSTGATTTCYAGWCRFNTCAAYPTSDVGEACDSDAVCVGAETAYEYSPSCGGPPGTQSTCGSPSTFCYALDGSGTGFSPICASGICKNNACTLVSPTQAGGSSTSDYECQGRDVCLDGACNDYGASCTADDGTQTGSTTLCDTGYCRFGSCASYPASNVGEACTFDGQCIGQETAYEYPPSCGGLVNTPFLCGGTSSFCYSLAGGSTGSSPVCATGLCKSNACTRPDPLGPGQACRGDYECLSLVTCVNGVCTGGEDTCVADDGNTQSIGPSTDCTSGFCRAGSCSNVPVALLGDICDEDRDCSGSDNNPSRNLLYCGQARANVRRCGSVGSYCLAADGTGTGPAPDLCISGQCVNYACIEVAPSPGLPRRATLPTQHVIKPRPCPKDFEPCPLYPKGFECIDIMNDIESCGGCVGRGMAGIDCSADIHAREISCVGGKCIISCEPGYSLASENNTCILE